MMRTKSLFLKDHPWSNFRRKAQVTNYSEEEREKEKLLFEIKIGTLSRDLIGILKATNAKTCFIPEYQL